MAGIAGCLALAGGTRPDADWVLRAVRRMAHRGPDDEHVISDGPVTLGARRLAVIDPSAGGRQPMRSADGRYVIVYNGEIYNYAELAHRLRARGVTLRGGSDTELLLETYAAEGKEALRKLRGMFAFAIWDAQTGELFCARDPFGIKPFYYALAEGGRQFRFASERKALLAPGEVSVIDPDALRRYLSFQYVPAPSTMTPPVICLPAGCFMSVRPGAPIERPSRYWRPTLRSAKSPAPDTPERVLTALRGSVAAHLRSDVPVGAFLSGGVDSAAIAQMAAESTPPDRNAPTGTSLRRWAATEPRNAASTRSGLSGAGDRADRSIGRQYLDGRSSGAPGRTLSEQPGGRQITGGVIVEGGGTYWNDRYLRSASGSITDTSPGASSALRSDANRNCLPPSASA